MIPMQALILVLLSSLAAAQEPAPDAPSSPRATLHRGAFVEEYERDLEAAAKLYAQAEEAARAGGDEATEKAAAAALARVQARRKGAPAAAAAQQGEDVVARIGELLTSLSHVSLGVNSDSPEWETYQAATSDLAVYGAAAVPWLEELLQPKPVQIGPYLVRLDTRMAARVLASQGTDEASAALARALQAKDPLIRRAVAEELKGWLHRGLLEQAARDPVPQVRQAAVSELMRQSDPALLPLVEPEAASGYYGAIQWILNNAPQRLLEMLAAPGASRELLDGGLRRIHHAKLPATTETADVLLRLGRELEDESQRGSAIYALRSYFQDRGPWNDAPEALRLHVQERLLAEVDRYPQPAAFDLLAEIGDVRALELLSRELTSWPADRSSKDTEQLLQETRTLMKRLKPGDFDTLAELYRELPLAPGSPADELEDKSWHANAFRTLADLAQHGEVTSTTLARGYEGLGEPRRAMYQYVISEWLRTRSSPENLQALVPAMRDMLANRYLWSQRAAIRGLQLAGDVESLPKVIELASGDSSGGDAWNAASSLCATDPERASALIVSAIRAGRIGHDAIRFLDPAHELALFRELWPEAEEPAQRAELIDRLIRDVPGPEADALIVELYPEIAVPGSRGDAIRRFARLLYEPAIPVLGQALEDPDQEVRQAARDAFHAFKEHREALEEFAAWTLGDRQAREQIDELTRLLASPDREVVLGAVKALGAVRARAALPALVRLLERDDETLRAAVHEAIERIGR